MAEEGVERRSRDPWFRYELVPAGATLVLAIVELWAASSPGRDWRLAIVAFLFGIPVAIVWLLLVLDRLLWRRVIGWRRIMFLVVSLPVLVAGTAAIAGTDIPIRIRLAVNDSALRELALSDPTAATVGSYDLKDFMRSPSGFQFMTSIDESGGGCGLAFSADGVPEGFPDFRYVHLDGPWYESCTSYLPD